MQADQNYELFMTTAIATPPLQRAA